MSNQKGETSLITVYFVVVIIAAIMLLFSAPHYYFGPETEVKLLDKAIVPVKVQSDEIFSKTSYSYNYVGHVEYKGVISKVEFTPEEYEKEVVGSMVKSSVPQCQIDGDCSTYAPWFYLSSAILVVLVVVPIGLLILALAG